MPLVKALARVLIRSVFRSCLPCRFPVQPLERHGEHSALWWRCYSWVQLIMFPLCFFISQSTDLLDDLLYTTVVLQLVRSSTAHEVAESSNLWKSAKLRHPLWNWQPSLVCLFLPRIGPHRLFPFPDFFFLTWGSACSFFMLTIV